MASIEKLEHDRVKLTIEVDADTFGAAVQQAYVKTAKHYNIPGFRKGHAPRKVIENMYGEGVFFEDAFEIVWGDAYDAALEEFELFAVDKPSIDIEKISLAEGVVFTAEVQLKPGEHFDAEIVGMTVYNYFPHTYIGTVVDVLSYPAHKLYKVKGEEKTYLIPAVKDIFITNVDEEAREISVHMIEGLETDED